MLENLSKIYIQDGWSAETMTLDKARDGLATLRQAIAEGHDMDKPEWQGLKPEEIEKLAKWADEHGHGPFHTDFAFAIDRLLRGKNLRRGEISQEPVAILNHAHGVHVFRNVKLNGLPDGEYAVYTEAVHGIKENT